MRIHCRTMRVLPTFLAALFLVAGCATRGYVRNEVGARAEALSAEMSAEMSAEIQSVQGEIAETQDGIEVLREQAEGQDARLDETEAALARTREDVNDAREGVIAAQGLAGEAMSTADTALERNTMLFWMFGNRNSYDVETELQVHFGFDSAQLSPEHGALLDGVGRELQANPDAIVVLEGRTDSTGNDAYNVRLGERRLEAVRQHLVIDLSVPVYRIHGVSYGEASPLYENNSLEERQKNRAVNIVVLSPASDESLSLSWQQ